MKTAICDDDPVICRKLKKWLTEAEPDAEVWTFASAEALLKSSETFPILLLDIHMSGMNGLDAARELKRRDEDVCIIFITRIRDYVFEAFDVEALHYLVKPVSRTKLLRVWRRAEALCKKKRAMGARRLIIHTKKLTWSIRYEDIVFAESQIKKTAIHTVTQIILCHENLADLEITLGGDFFRCHRGYLVNMAFIAAYSAEEITLTDGTRLYMARERYAAFNMVVFHFLYDVFIVYGKAPSWYGLPTVHIWQQMICRTFIFISGFVWPWGIKGNFRRGLRFNLYGIIISIVTLIVIPSEAIWFGILNFTGCAVLLMLPLQKIAKKIPPIFGLISCFLLFIFFKQIQHGYVGIGNMPRIEIPSLLYSIKILTPFGFPFIGFRSSDYFPILPWIFLYLCGYFSNKFFMKYDLCQRIARYKIPFLSDMGSRTIWIYMIHQPLSMLLCGLIFR